MRLRFFQSWYQYRFLRLRMFGLGISLVTWDLSSLVLVSVLSCETKHSQSCTLSRNWKTGLADLCLCLIPYILTFYVSCIIGLMDGWSNWVDLARSSFGVLSVYFFSKLSVVTMQLEHFTLVEWCPLVSFSSYSSCSICYSVYAYVMSIVFM